MSEIHIADWVRKVAGDRAPLKDLREWEHRIVAAYSELLDGYKADVPAILNDIARVRRHPGLVLEQGINFTSICYHHFLPFFGTIDVAYEPAEVITGLGRIVELVQALAHRLQIQEFLVRDIAETIKEGVGAKGVFVRSRAVHLCVHSRGPSDHTMETICTYAVGSLETIERQAQLSQLLAMQSR
ncbi:MAG TPA: GTP cyclohydrolase I [Gemmataceae bacterium]|nr:GTP cyclohydrolase I [Gemmataceae bacterium]